MKVRRTESRWGLALCGLIAGGCHGAAPQDITISWLLADGRSCIDAAVPSVAIQALDPSAPGGGNTVTSACPANPRLVGRVLVPALTAGQELKAIGLSSSGTVLYRGALTVPDPAPPSLDLTLYFTGGE